MGWEEGERSRMSSFPPIPRCQSGLEGLPCAVKGLKAAGCGVSGPFQKEVACERSENVTKLAS